MTRMLCAVVLVLLNAGAAASQSAELGLTVGVSAFNDNGIGSLRSFEQGMIPANLGNGVRIGTRWSTNSWTFLGHEFSYAYQRSSLKIGDGPSEGMSVQNIYYNFVAHATPSARRCGLRDGRSGRFRLLSARGVVAFRRRQ